MHRPAQSAWTTHPREIENPSAAPEDEVVEQLADEVVEAARAGVVAEAVAAARRLSQPARTKVP